MGDRSRYFLSSSSWSAAYGAQVVLITWLVLNYLGLGGSELGIVQASFQLPLLMLPLFGILIESRGRRQVLFVCHLFAMLPPLLLVTALSLNALNMFWLVVTTSLLGMISAFSMPARDALLADIAADDLQRMVAIATGIQFGVQAIGFALGAMADYVGAAPLFAVQAGIFLAGALALRKTFANENTEVSKPEQASSTRDVASALKNDGVVLACLALNCGIGVFFIATFQVVVPTIISQTFGGGSAAIAGAFVAFLIGTLISTSRIIATGGVDRAGRAFILALVTGCGMCVAIGMASALWMVYMALLCWGMGAGYAMSMGRTLVQERTDAGHRARVMSVYQLCLVGSAPLGSVGFGFLVDSWGTSVAVYVAGFMMLCLVLAVLAMSNVWRTSSTTARKAAA